MKLGLFIVRAKLIEVMIFVLDTYGRSYVQPVIQRTGRFLLRRGLTADHVTTMAFVVGVSSKFSCILRISNMGRCSPVVFRFSRCG